MSKLLILGGSNCQISAFKRAKEKGIDTVLFDYLDNPPCAKFASEHIKISTFDINACLAEAKKFDITGVMTLGTDQPVYTAALIAEAMGLPSLISVETALAVTNKRVMKGLFTKNAIPTLPYRFMKSSRDKGHENLKFPLVIKPLDSHGQKGVFKIKNQDELDDLFTDSLSFSREDELLVEEYYPSKEITASAWVKDFSCNTLCITDRINIENERHIGICKAHRYPSKALLSHEKEVEEIMQKLPACFGIKDGPLYVQFLIGESGVFINELACRIGGAFEDSFIPAISGFDILANVMNTAINSDLFEAKIPKRAKFVRVIMLFAKAGIISFISDLSEIKALPYIAEAGFNFSVGERLGDIKNASARLGYAVILAGTEVELEGYIKHFRDEIQVLDENNISLLI